MKHAPKILTALIVATLCAFVFTVSGCLTPQDTQRVAVAHQAFETEKQATAADLATNTITAEQAAARMEAAIKALGDELKAAGKDVKDRTGSFDWSRIVELGLSSLLGFGATNIYRNQREVKVWGAPPPKGT